MSRPFRVLKFGGTSVATVGGWDVIAARAKELLPTHRVFLVVSALAGVSNRLEQAVREALSNRPLDSMTWIEEAHRTLGERGELSDEDLRPHEALLEETRRLLEGARLTGEATPRLQARVLAVGELAAARIGVSLLSRRGVHARLVDARELLVSESQPGDPLETRYLNARVAPVRSPEAIEDLAPGSDVVLTQGFIARTRQGETCLLGRGGSDTSAALFAALLGADELEIWTDVHGLFTADPRQIPTARLIRNLGYREAEELATMGARVLHPRCLSPVAWAGIPVRIRCTEDPTGETTRVEAADEEHPAVTAVACRSGVALVTISTLAMWEASGFLARVFAPFDELGISVDLVATSESAVSVTLDRIPGGVEGDRFEALIARLSALGTVKVVHPCAVISIVGRRIRTVLHELGPAMAAFQDRPVHLLSQSSEDLNLSFVVDEDEAPSLLARLHDHLFPAHASQERLGPTWEMLRGRVEEQPRDVAWWRRRRRELLDLGAHGSARYAYDLPTVVGQARALRNRLPAVGGFYYAMKANPHPAILRALAAEGFGIECVSAAEILAARREVGDAPALLFTPNFCPLDEYRIARESGAEVTVDGEHVLDEAPSLFRGAELALRVDPGRGIGHHEKVRTAGAQAKFGQRLDEIDRFREAAARHAVRVVGLHAHVGSGILDPEVWLETGRVLLGLSDRFPDLRWIDLGGGLGVPERPGQKPMDLGALQAGLLALKVHLRDISLRLEPGRYLVSEAGVLLCPVTQVRRKGTVLFVGVATGMNSFLRPALYGAWHGIHNLTRLDDDPAEYAHVVGPICESADVLGRDRRLPKTSPGDILLIENAGAYGAAMASRYNLREPAEEVVLE